MPRPKKLLTNDNTDLKPVTEFSGRTLELDFPDLHIGVAEYDEGPTGCTVFHFPGGATTAVDRRGGAVGAIGLEYRLRDAICFAGGSAFGLEVAAGVRAELLASLDYKITWNTLPSVAGAIIWDWSGRKNAVYPDKELGRAALRAALSGRFPLGARGAGRSASVGKWLSRPHTRESAGQGGAFYASGPTRVAVFTVVNAIGAIGDRNGNVVRGHLNRRSGERSRVQDIVKLESGVERQDDPPPGNTTLTFVATNHKLARPELEQLAAQVHGSMARAINPFHTLTDGDILFASTTAEVRNKGINPSMLSHIASELAWDAVLNCFD
ncbi:MAG: P1 family peptidase [Candidatus Latescibacteria bacterium]|nr:P1 family peptidase [Candidatus Latescibacterota bacterium]